MGTARAGQVGSDLQPDQVDAAPAVEDHEELTGDGRTRVMLVDELVIWRAGLRSILAAAGGIQVVGEIQPGERAAGEVARVCPDVLLLDVIQRHGTQLLWDVRSTQPAIRVIVMTLAEGPLVRFACIAAGVSAILSKRVSQRDLIQTIRAVAEGRDLVGPAVVAPTLAPVDRQQPADSRLSALSPRELSVLSLLTEGMSNREIAVELGVSPMTVKRHVAAVLSKLGVKRRGEAAARLRGSPPGGDRPGSLG